MNFAKYDPIKVYAMIQFWSSLLFSVIVTVNLVYQGNGGGAKPIANDTGGDNARNHFVFI